MMRGGRLFLLQEKDNNHSDHSYNSETKKKSEPANADCHITSYVGPASRFLQSRPERLLVAPIHEPLPTFLRSSRTLAATSAKSFAAAGRWAPCNQTMPTARCGFGSINEIAFNPLSRL